MSFTACITQLLPKIINYKLARYNVLKPTNPITFTFAITYMCQSKCTTCKIWRIYKETPEKRDEELSIWEIKEIFESTGHVYFFNVSGGEPYLRHDLPEIIELAIKHMTPGIIHIPTNGLAPDIIRKSTLNILRRMQKLNCRTPITIKPSLDGIGEKHDKIRGVKGNFNRVLTTIKLLKDLCKEYPNLYVEIGTVISTMNMADIDEISNYVHKLGIESYRNEIAEQRSEFFNLDDPITPSAEQYADLMEIFAKKIRNNIHTKKQLTRITEALRLTYYDIAIKILKEKQQVIPCYAGISNIQLNPYGELWPCCVLGYERPMGDLRKFNYDFRRAFHSEQANAVRKFIRDGGCFCPLANQVYSNILCNFIAMLSFSKNFFFHKFGILGNLRRNGNGKLL